MKNQNERKAGRPATGKQWPVTFQLMLSEDMKEFLRLEAADQDPKISECALVRSYLPKYWKSKLRRLRMEGAGRR